MALGLKHTWEMKGTLENCGFQNLQSWNSSLKQQPNKLTTALALSGKGGTLLWTCSLDSFSTPPSSDGRADRLIPSL